MNSKISIVIPAYNASAFIDRTVESVKQQSYSNWELIIVNDGSKDNTGAVIDRFATKDNRIRTIHKENGGEVSARKAGVENSTGEWIMFLDADDILPSSSITSLLACDTGADIIVGTMHVHETDGEGNIINEYVWKNKKTGKMSGTEFAKGIFMTEIQMSACAKLYKRDLFNGFEWCLDKTIKQNPDLLMNIGIGAMVKDVCVSNDAVCYDYVIRKGSASTSGMMPFDGWFHLFDKAKEYLRGYSVPSSPGEAFLRYRIACFDGMLRHGIINFSSSDRHVTDVVNGSKSITLNNDEKKVVLLIQHKSIRVLFNWWQKYKQK